MITLNYAKKVGDAYVLNFFADSEEDIEKFDITKEFMFYGVPSAGSLITCVSKDSSTNYYVDKSGSLVKIDQDQPTPSLTPFSVGQTITGVDFGAVSNGETSSAMDAFLAGLTYEDAGGMLVSTIVFATPDSEIVAITDGSAFYGIMTGDGEFLYANSNMQEQGIIAGYQNLNDGKYALEQSASVTSISDAQGWNGILIGAVEGEPGPTPSLTPFQTSHTYSSLVVDTTAMPTGYESFGEWFDAVTPEANESTMLIAGPNFELTIYGPGSQGPAMLRGGFFHNESGEDKSFLLYINEDIEGPGGETLHPGFYLNASSGSIVPIEDTTFTLTFSDVDNIPTSQTISKLDTDFEAVNGAVFGGVEVEPGPTPSLTPFSVGQTITGIDFGSVQNGDTNADLDAFLAGLTYDQGTITLVGVSDAAEPVIAAFDLSEFGGDGYALFQMADGGTDCLYGTKANDIGGGQMVVTLGYQNLTDGKFALVSSKTINYIDQSQGWNGILMGAVEGEAPQPSGLTPLEDSQILSKIKIDPTITTVNVDGNQMSLNDWLDTFDATNPYLLAHLSSDGYTDDGFSIVNHGGSNFFMGAIRTKGISYFSQETEGMEPGWYVVDQDGEPSKITEPTEVSFDENVTVIKVTGDFAPLNGVIIGAIVAE